jgi:hypothetical protein
MCSALGGKWQPSRHGEFLFRVATPQESDLFSGSTSPRHQLPALDNQFTAHHWLKTKALAARIVCIHRMPDLSPQLACAGVC